jgi:uncharacterized tellurite resistance protein B-like protein
MNFSDFITDHGKRVSKEHYIHLIQVSKIDGKISPPEIEMLHKEGRKFGLTDPEIDKLIVSESFDNFDAPYSLIDKFDQLYNIAELILADEVITDSEKRMMKRYAISAGFRDEVIDDLLALLLEGVAKGDDEEKLFKEFKKINS